MKRVGVAIQYFGVDLVITLPFVATDSNGNVYEYRERPNTLNEGIFMETGEVNELGKVDLEGLDWKASLVEFKI